MEATVPRDEAGHIYRRIVDLWTRAAGAADPRTAQARSNLADFLEARGRLAEAQEVRGANAKAENGKEEPLPAPKCPVTATELTPPPWNPDLANALFTVALEHEERIAHALGRQLQIVFPEATGKPRTRAVVPNAQPRRRSTESRAGAR